MPGRVSVSFAAKGFLLGLFLVAMFSANARAGGLTASDAIVLRPIAVSLTASAASGDVTGDEPTMQLTAPSDAGNDATSPEEQDPTRPNVDPDAPLPTVEYDLDKLPEPVRAMRERIIEAAKTGSVEALRPLIGSGDDRTDFGGDAETDPLTYLKSLSGDAEGREVLAILLDILDSGYVHLNAGTENELYAWPYFFAYPLDKLTPRQMVELLRIVTAGDYDQMKEYGAYIFYRTGITPDGKWRFFLTGE